MINNQSKLCIFILILLLTLNVPFSAQEEEKPLNTDETLNYKVSVNVMVVPVFAVDGKGNPIHDLKEEELRLFVNDEPIDILDFKRYEFGHEETIVQKIESKEPVKIVRKPENRYVFIILDTMFNTLTGFRRSKDIAVKLVNQASPGDRFIILENNTVSGLKYIGGSESDKKTLIKKIKKISTPPDKWSPDMYNSRIINPELVINTITDIRMETIRWEGHRKLNLDSERQKYQHQVKHFAHLLSQFKYALKSIDKPKIVFLISEGISLGAFRAALNATNVSDVDVNPSSGNPMGLEDTSGSLAKGFYSILYKTEKRVFDQNKIYSAFMLNYLLEVVKSINNGGSVLYTINPRRTNMVNDDEKSGEMSLRYLAGESGGKYFAGSKPAKIIEQVKKTTAAYYELFYTIRQDMGKNMKVRVSCLRKNVHVHSLVHTERNRPYARMEPVQKKLFAFNVVTNGSWSRMVGKVMMAKFKKTAASKEKLMTIRVPLPKIMQNRDVDMFSIHVDPQTQKTEIDVVSSKASDVVNLKIKPRKDKNQFFVIIEPTTPHCIYNQI